MASQTGLGSTGICFTHTRGDHTDGAAMAPSVQDPALVTNPNLFIWTGARSTDWWDKRNWLSNFCDSIPHCPHSVLIPAGAPRYPVIDRVCSPTHGTDHAIVYASGHPLRGQPASCDTIFLENGASIQVIDNHRFNVCGDFIHQGYTFFDTGLDTVAFVGIKPQNYVLEPTGTGELGTVVVANTTPYRPDLRGVHITQGDMVLHDNARLVFETGKVFTTAGNAIEVRNRAATAIVDFDSLRYVQGNLRRHLLPDAAASYPLPVGVADSVALSVDTIPGPVVPTIGDGVTFSPPATLSAINHWGGYPPTNARLNMSSNGWGPSCFPCGTQLSARSLWWQADYGEVVTFSGFATQGTPGYWTSAYEVQVSNDGVSWSSQGDFSGNTNASTVVSHTFSSTVQGRYFRIVPTASPTSNWPALRVEIYVKQPDIYNINWAQDKGYQLAEVDFANTRNNTFLNARFNKWGGAPASVNMPSCNRQISCGALDNGYWTISPFINAPDNSYRVFLHHKRHTAAPCGPITVIKRNTSWNLHALDACHPTQSIANALVVRSNFISGFSDFASEAGTELPLSISHLFLRARAATSQINVSWDARGTDMNQSRFVLERTDDLANNLSWTAIHETAAHNYQQQYHFPDVNVAKNVNYTYRLRYVDNDGSEAMSNLASAILNDGSNQSVRIFPNPAHAHLNLQFQGFSSEETVHIRLVNNLGQTIYQVQHLQLLNDRHAIDVQNYAAGIYALLITSASGFQHYQQIKIEKPLR
jgi:hypothetical protein